MQVNLLMQRDLDSAWPPGGINPDFVLAIQILNKVTSADWTLKQIID